MDHSVVEIQPNVWRVSIASITRIVRYRTDSRTFAPWEVASAEGQVLWSASSLESALRWIEAHTGYPIEALFTQALLERTGSSARPEAKAADESTASGADRRARPLTSGRS
ncbi:MAG TPA: hypothetical protein VNX02_06310 [Steroidobacteraceae bacterium]|jgi:hypothetical protein|nr:hypothetical protein [Steroidobacteraceae bacterium]